MYHDLVKYICAKQLTKGEGRIPRAPTRYKDYTLGLLLEGFAQEKHPDAISQGRLPNSDGELQFAIDRLQKIANTPYVLPEFEQYFLSLDQPLAGRDISTGKA